MAATRVKNYEVPSFQVILHDGYCMGMKATTPAGRYWVLYDDGCAMCTFQMRLLTWLDWFNVVTLVPMSSPRVAEIAPQLKSADLEAAIHCVTPERRVYRGARCLRFVGMRMPLLIPLALLLWIPGVIWIAERVYAWVSRNRYMLSRVFRCKEACGVLPERERAHQKEVELK